MTAESVAADGGRAFRAFGAIAQLLNLATLQVSEITDNGKNIKETRENMKNTAPQVGRPPSELIAQQIEKLGDWRGKLLAQLRKLILDAAPEVTEEWKWGTAVWVHQGNVVAAGAFKDHIKLNFFKGATLDDPSGLFNAGFEAKAIRTIDFHQGDKINVAALKELVQAAVALNASGGKKKQK